eukprot:6173588-Pleurochrysis_carterae.AAC.1
MGARKRTPAAAGRKATAGVSRRCRDAVSTQQMSAAVLRKCSRAEGFYTQREGRRSEHRSLMRVPAILQVCLKVRFTSSDFRIISQQYKKIIIEATKSFRAAQSNDQDE